MKRAAMARRERVRVPLAEVVRAHGLPLLQGALAIVVCYALFYISTVFALGYGVNAQHIPRTTFLAMLCIAVVFMALTTPISARLADAFHPVRRVRRQHRHTHRAHADDRMAAAIGCAN